MIQRAEACGAQALVVTRRHHDARLAAPGPQPRLAAVRAGRGHRAVHLGPALPRDHPRADRRAPPAAGREGRRSPLGALRSLLSITRNYPGRFLDNLRSQEPRAAVETFLDIYSNPGLSWDHLATLRGRTTLPILLKGILHPDDAARALDAGVDGLIVSNHGGRQVDHSIASLDALVGVRERVGPEPTLLFDSGIRTGADVFLALALGADACLLGRPHLYGLALAGADGVTQVIENVDRGARPDHGPGRRRQHRRHHPRPARRGVLAMADRHPRIRRRAGRRPSRCHPASTSPRTSRCSAPAPRSTSSPRTGRFTLTTDTDEQQTWSWADLMALPAEDVEVDIHCVTRWSKLRHPLARRARRRRSSRTSRAPPTT